MKERIICAATEDDAAYAALESLMRTRIAHATGPFFTTDADPDDLWRAYLNSLPANQGHYRCHACCRFIRKYGGLVTVDKDGDLQSAVWPTRDAPSFFSAAVDALNLKVWGSKITGVFLWSKKERVWGTPQTGAWTHLSGTPSVLPYSNSLLTTDQVMADKKQDHGILVHALADYSKDATTQACACWRRAVYRSEKALAVAEWFLALHNRLEGIHGPRRNNLLWAAVATAPPGFCHMRTHVVSTLLDDVKAALPFDAVAKRWAEKLHPLQYQRPTFAAVRRQHSAGGEGRRASGPGEVLRPPLRHPGRRAGVCLGAKPRKKT